MSSLSKENQLRKTKKINPKRMTKKEFTKYCDFIIEISFGNCQICRNIGDDMHHSSFGRQGANKDDRSILLVCRKCHDKCHADREFNQKAIIIGKINHNAWRQK